MSRIALGKNYPQIFSVHCRSGGATLLKQPAEALKAFEASAQREPNRFRGVYGAAQAAALSGDRDKAKMYYAKFVALTEKTDDAKPEVRLAKAYLAQL